MTKNELQTVPTVQKQSRLQTFLNRGAVVAVLASAGGAANAAGEYDVSAIVTNLGLAVTAAATIGVTWLGFTAGIAIWRNLRSAAK